jgi:hypothetical protein
MALTDITSVFSRYFVVGFVLPAYFALVALWFSASSTFLPNIVEDYSTAVELAILGGVALVVGLALSGVSHYLTRLFEGYPLERSSTWPLTGWVYRQALVRQRVHYDRLRAIYEDSSRPEKDRQRALVRLERFFPSNREALLPTRLGNAIRSFERHSNTRWGLDGVTIWPRIEALLSSDEREVLVDAKVNFYVFMNAAVGAFAVGVCLIVDKALNDPTPMSSWLLYALPFALGYVLYRAAVGPATDWGDSVRSSIDLHRLEVYEKLGVRAPTSFSDERALGVKVNQFLLYGRPLLSDELWRGEDASRESEETGRGDFLACVRKCLMGGD